LALLLLQPAGAPLLGTDVYAGLYRFASVLMTAGVLVVALVANRRDNRVLLDLSQKLARDLVVEQRRLEQRVNERTRALETSAAVSRRLSTILDQSRLVREVVEQLRDAFAYYHVHVFLWDESAGLLRLVGGTGEAGQSMMVMGHALTPEQGLVGRAYSARSPIVAPDVEQQPDWLPNRLLPGTKAEIAVPIIYGEDVLGVLDAQDDEVNGLGQEDAQLLQTIAGQLAVALRNARLVAQIQKEADQEVIINAISRKITQTSDIHEAMEVALVELSRVLEPQAASIRLESDSGNGHDH
jgi:GAF domain-containing protein